MQPEAPAAVTKLPAAHSEHTELPALDAYLPAVQATQDTEVEAPVVPEAVPTSHEIQVDAAAKEYVPARQPMQEEVAAYLPALQLVHAVAAAAE